MIIFTKFHENLTKNVDFLSMANFCICLFFSTHFKYLGKLVVLKIHVTLLSAYLVGLIHHIVILSKFY